MSAHIANLVPELQQPCRDLIAACDAAGLQPRLTSTLRSHAEQKRLYDRYLAGQAGFPVAPPGQSAHEYGEAFDLVVSPMEALADVGYTWQTWGGGWGPGDAVHFELPGATSRARRSGPDNSGLTVRDWLLQEYNAIPWWISALLPIETTAQAATSEKTTYLRSLIQKYGL